LEESTRSRRFSAALAFLLDAPLLRQRIGGGDVDAEQRRYEAHGKSAPEGEVRREQASGLGLAWALAIAIVSQYVLNRTRFGLHTIATGGNLLAAEEVGIKVRSIKIRNFVLCSMLGGLAGIIDAFRIGSIEPLAGGSEIMFMAIASAVIGGTLLTGGSGTVVGALIGALALGILQDGFTLSGVSAFTFDMILGGAILVTMTVNVRLTLWRERGGG
jgi:simple sugar transport system permease protein